MAVRSLFAATLLLLATCEQPEQDVVLRWTFAGGHGCDAAGVQTVHVFIGPLAPTGSYDHEVECSVGEQALRLQGVAPGRHVLFLKGLAHDHTLYSLERDLDVTQDDIGAFDLPPYVPPTF
jgi:hypothetical protein